MPATMTRKHKPKIDNRIAPAVIDERTIEPVPRKRNFVAPECSLCIETRPKGESYTRVYATVRGEIGITRYCKCGYCGNTFKSVSVE